MAENIFGSTLEEIQKRAYAASAKRRQQAGMLAAQNSNRPGLHAGLGQAFHRLGASMFGGGQGSEEDRLKAEEGEALTQEMRALDSDGTVESAMGTARELIKRGAVKEAMVYYKLGQVRQSMKPTTKYETWYNADGSSEKVQEINGIPVIDGKKVDPTKMQDIGMYPKKPDEVDDGAVFGKDYRPTVEITGNQLNTIRKQLAGDPLLATYWGNTPDEAKQKLIGDSLAGRVEAVVQDLKYEEYLRVTAAADAGEMTKVEARRAMNKLDSHWVREGLKLYIEGGGINFDVNSGDAEVNQGLLTLQGLRANQKAGVDDRRFRAEANEKYGAGVIGTRDQYRVEELSFDEGAELFTALANGSITPEQSIQAQEDARDGETFSPEMKNYQLVVRQGMADNPRLVATFFGEPDNRKRANLMEKYIDELQQTNLQKFHEQKQLLIHLARIQPTVYNPKAWNKQANYTSTPGTDLVDAMNTAGKQVNYDTTGAKTRRNSMGRYN